MLSSLPPPLDLQDQDPASELTQSSNLNTTTNNKVSIEQHAKVDILLLNE